MWNSFWVCHGSKRQRASMNQSKFRIITWHNKGKLWNPLWDVFGFSSPILMTLSKWCCPVPSCWHSLLPDPCTITALCVCWGCCKSLKWKRKCPILSLKMSLPSFVFTQLAFFSVLSLPRSGKTLYRRMLAWPLLSLLMKEGKSQYLIAPLP